MQNPSCPQVYLMLVVVTLLWSGNSIVARAIYTDIPPFTLAAARWTGALAVIVPFAWPKLRADLPRIRHHWRSILLLGLVGVASFNAFLYWGLRYTTATNGLLLQAGIPALVLLFDFAFFRIRPRGAQVVGVTVAAAGVATIVFKADPAALLALQFNRGDALILCAVLAWALYTTFLRLRPAIHAVSFLTLTFAIGAATMAPLAAAELRTFAIHFTPTVIGALVYVALLPSVVAYFLYNKAVATIGAGEAGQAISLQPLFGALLAAALLGEALHLYHLVGMALIVAGLVIPMVGHRPGSEPAAPSRWSPTSTVERNRPWE